MAKQFEEYNVKRNKVIRLLDECISKISDEKLLKVINEKKEQLSEDRFVVSVFGHFSNGKSTFLNSLMGFDHEVLREDDNASTATITRLRYADSMDIKCNKFDVIYKDESIDSNHDIDDLGDFVARNGKDDVERTIREVILYIDSPFLKYGVEIVDTPGFNSTYEIHSEIALQQVEKSDAAIFLFSVDQPGNGEEFEFLKKVRNYMNRVFFVLNKVDKSDDNGFTEKTDIFNKMSRIGIDARNKRMYMISALRAREALAENDDDKLKISGLVDFETALTQYLTGEEFVKDRLLAPLGSAYTLIGCERESVSDQIAACSKDRAELNTEIQSRKKEVRERETEINNAKRGIVSSVKSELLTTKAQVKEIVKKVGNAQTERLSKINSKFDIRLANFEDLNRETFLMFSNEWEDASELLENRLLDILNTSVDSEEEYTAISETITLAIRSHLLLEQICVDSPEFDFSELSKIDEEISKAKQEYDKAYSKVSNLYALNEDKNAALSEIEKIEKEFDRLRNEKEKRIDSLYTVQVEYGYEMERYDAYVKRSNRIIQRLCGDKRVERDRRKEYKDSRAHDAAMEEVKKIEMELEQSRIVRKEQVEKIRASIESAEFKQIERKIKRAEEDEQDALNELMQRRETQREEKRAMEREIITVEKDKFLHELKKNLEEMGKTIISFLNQSQKNFVSILSICLDRKYEAITREKNNIEKMVRINDQTPEEINKRIVELNKEMVDLTDCMKKIEQEKEAI